MGTHPGRDGDDFEVAADALLESSRALLAISVRSVLNAPVELTVAQHRVLLILAEHGPLAVGQVAALLGVDQSNAGRHCQRLHQAGLVDRVRSEVDRRSIEVVINEAGAQVLAAVTAARRHDIADVLAGLTPDEVSTVARSLSAFNRAAAERQRRMSMALDPAAPGPRP